MIVTVSSVRGAPGVTTWSLALAAALASATDRQRVVLEADPDGGVLGARYDLGVEPGVVSLVSSMRRDAGVPDPGDHGRAIGSDLVVVPGPESAEQATTVWEGAAGNVAAAIAADDRVWVVDAGRLRRHGVQASFGRHAHYHLLVSGCRREDLVQLPARVEWLAAGGAPVGLVVVGALAYRRDDLAVFAGAELVAASRRDDEALDLAANAASGGRARRSWLWQLALETAGAVGQRLAAGVTPLDPVVAPS